MAILTHVEVSKKFEKQVSRLPQEIQEKARFWIYSVQFRGIWEVMKSRSYHDEPLIGTRAGQRSVRLNKAYRIIYTVIHDRVHIELLEVHKHAY